MGKTILSALIIIIFVLIGYIIYNSFVEEEVIVNNFRYYEITDKSIGANVSGCTDTDPSFFKADEVTYFIGNESFTKEDECDRGGVLKEAICTGGNIGTLTIDCLSTCVDGACANMSFVSCEDNQTEIDTFDKGEIVYEYKFVDPVGDIIDRMKRQDDECHQDTLHEYYCLDRKPGLTKHECVIGCHEGECIQ